MNYHDIKHVNMANGSGLRSVIWVAGCSHNCPGCFNPHTHDPNSGQLFDKEAKDYLFRDLDKDWCAGITFSGGDPLFESNVSEILNLCKEIKEKFPNKNIWLYTGYTYNEIINDNLRRPILNYIDVICDGPYIESLKSPDKPWVGSSNQNVIDIKERIRQVSEINHL